jgi:hypothetical protein
MIDFTNGRTVTTISVPSFSSLETHEGSEIYFPSQILRYYYTFRA